MIRSATRKFVNYPHIDKGALRVDVIGDSGPFSEVGKSIGYRVSFGGKFYLLDCGAPLFQQLGIEGVREIDALFATHSHDDHKRWFTDLALFLFYSTNPRSTLRLVTSDDLQSEFRDTSRAALERSLSFHSNSVVEVPYENFIRTTPIGPKAKFRIEQVTEPDGECTSLRVLDSYGNAVPPNVAKVVVHPWGSRPRMLFKDPETGLWVEPGSYYSFSESAFYEKDQRNYCDSSTGLVVEAHNAAQWHGPSTIGYKFITPSGEKLAFSSDTVYDPDLWQKLAEEVRPLPPECESNGFSQARILRDDINKYIQKTWSNQRLLDAKSQYEGCALIHDVAGPKSVVHTDYNCLLSGVWRDLILTHSPDLFTSQIPLMQAGMCLLVHRNKFYEFVGDRPFPFKADYYFKYDKRYFVGKVCPDGKWKVLRGPKGLYIQEPQSANNGDEVVASVRVFESAGGRYFEYRGEQGVFSVRRDGRVEFLHEEPTGSRGEIVEDLREREFGPPLKN